MDESQSTAEDVDNTDQGRSIPFDSNSSIYFIIPEAGAGDVESTIGLLHNDAVSNELEVAIDCCDVLENLY